MVRENRHHWEMLEAKAREYERMAKQYFDLARKERGREPEQVLVDGKLRRKSVNWRPADSAATILQFGERFLPEAEFLKELVDGGHVAGATEEKKYESARIVLTRGLAKEYLFRSPQGIGYRTGNRKSKVLKKA